MPGTSTNLGKQQVSIYPFQQLSSVYGNEVNFGIHNPGVYSAAVEVTIVSTNVNFIIKAGTTLIFQRQAKDPLISTQDDALIGKITLGDDVTITYPKSTIWGAGSSPWNESSALYIVADWTYDIADPTKKYASFSVLTDSGASPAINIIKSYDGTYSHLLVIAVLLNHYIYVGTSSNDPSLYHMSYDYQANRDVFKKEYIKNNRYQIDFDGKGRGVYVSAGHSLIGGKLAYSNTAFGQTYSYLDNTLPWGIAKATNSSYDEGHYLPNRSYHTAGISNDTPNDSANILRPALGLQYYYSDTGLQTNIPIDIITTATQSSYYQIDFLRVKKDEISHSTTIGWESFLQLKPSLAYSEANLDFITYGKTPNDYSAMIPSNLMFYLSHFHFPIVGDGETLLIAIRERTTTPVADGVTNILWPDSCLFMNQDSVPQFGGSPKHSRLKMPVWNASDIGAY
jgi:hypothetical protein